VFSAGFSDWKTCFESSVYAYNAGTEWGIAAQLVVACSDSKWHYRQDQAGMAAQIWDLLL